MWSALCLAQATQEVYTPKYHRVKAGESLFSIAQQYQLKLHTLQKLNKIEDANDIRIGQQLFVGYELVTGQKQKTTAPDKRLQARTPFTVPSGYEPVYHRVKKQENLYGIARQYDISINRLLEWNSLSRSSIKTGQRLVVAIRPTETASLPSKPEKPTTRRSQPTAPEAPTPKKDTNETARSEDQASGTKELPTQKPVPIEAREAPVSESFVLLDYFFSLPAIIKFLYFVITFLLLSTIISYIIVMISRTLKIKQNQKIPKLHRIYHFYFTLAMFDEQEYKMFDEAYRQNKKNEVIQSLRKEFLNIPFRRKVLAELILYLHKNMIGQMAQEYRDFYIALGFLDDSYRKLKKRNWHLKVQGIRELAQLNIKEAYPQIAKFINHPNPILRTEAQLGLIKISHTDPLSFLDQLKYRISTWDQLNILALLDQFDRNELPVFEKWLSSENDSVVVFSLQMIAHFNQMETVKEVTRLLKHTAPEVREAAVRTLSKLDAASFIGSLKRRFKVEENKRVKLAILDCFKTFAIEKDIPFLEEQLEHPDYEIRMNIAKIMLAIGEAGKQELKKILQQADLKLKSIIYHVLDKRIAGIHG